MPGLADLTADALAAYKGTTIADHCGTNFVAANVNHCAHFVSHVIGLTIGMKCGDMTFATRGQGGSIRVNEIYNRCTPRGAWGARPVSLTHCLAFVTRPGNMAGTVMGEAATKHIGIFVTDTIWHYSNRADLVVTDSPESFLIKFQGTYGADTQMFYGVI